MALTDLSRMTVAERIALAEELAQYQERDKRMIKLVEDIKSSVEVAEFELAEVVDMLMQRETRQQSVARKSSGAKQSKAAKNSAVDETGEKAKPGVTYVNPDTKVEWTKDKSGRGAPKKEFVALIISGKTWKELEKPSSPIHKKPQ